LPTPVRQDNPGPPDRHGGPRLRFHLELLRLDQLTLVCPWDTACKLEPRVRLRGLNRLIQSGLHA
jgi:hypothetical protein